MKKTGSVVVLVVLVATLGCAQHRATLYDSRIQGVQTEYRGNTPPGALARARYQMVITDRLDQVAGKLVAEENPGYYWQLYNRLEENLKPVVYKGSLVNKTHSRWLVTVKSLSTGEVLFSSIYLEPRSAFHNFLEEGRYRVIGERLSDGYRLSRIMTVRPGQQWLTIIYPL